MPRPILTLGMPAAAALPVPSMRDAFHGYRLGGDGVVQADCSTWKTGCPHAAEAVCPLGCAEFRRELRLDIPVD
ncbi:hypothetical protein ASF34_21190 [Methylobacterium sp. Leaf106]|jgi:hypothetical protein|nr:hypothetical protein ASF34_21190 [Methylobacterium sp. Leaf106]